MPKPERCWRVWNATSGRRRGSRRKIVQDANYVELLGVFGVAKAFLTGGARGQSLEETARRQRGLYQYLDKVRFRTPVGRRLAQEGREYAKRFLERLRREW